MGSQNYAAVDFPVPDDQLQRIISDWIEVLDSEAQSSDDPNLTYIVGQPGAGKSARIDAIFEVAATRPFAIDSDVIRLSHPRMKEILTKDPISMDVLSNGIVGPVTVALLDHARENHQSLILENTLTNPEVVANTIQAFRDAGYGVDMHVVATPEQLSQIGILDRYAQATKTPRFPARWTRPLAHQTAYNAIPKGLVALQGKVDTVIVSSRQQGEVYRGSDMQQATNTLQRLRQDDWNDSSKQYFAEKYIQNQPLMRDRDFSTHPYVAPLLEAIYETAARIPEYVRAAQEKAAQTASPTALAGRLGLLNYDPSKAHAQDNTPTQQNESVHLEMKNKPTNEL